MGLSSLLASGRLFFRRLTVTRIPHPLTLLAITAALFCSPTITHAMSTKTTSPRDIVIVGAGIQGTSVAYHLAEQTTSSSTRITLLEAIRPASAASGKGGGFMARSWGSGPTEPLHQLAFDMYEQLALELNCESYRKLPVLSVTPGSGTTVSKRKNTSNRDLVPSWLDGSVGQISPLGYGDDTAQITPSEFVDKMLNKHKDRIQVVQGTCVGVECDDDDNNNNNNNSDIRRVTAVQYETAVGERMQLAADVVVVSAGPWSCAAEDWFPGAVKLPMEGVKSTSIVWKRPGSLEKVDATALFCGEHDRYGTHLEVYPRPNGEIYICGIGGSDYITTEELKQGAFRDSCSAKPDRVDAAMSSFREMSSTYEKYGELEKTQACMRPCPPDARPYMGPIDGYAGAYINAGHNCWGIAWAPACGKAMAELILEGESRSINLKSFSPSRFTPVAQRGDRGRKKKGMNVGEQW